MLQTLCLDFAKPVRMGEATDSSVIPEGLSLLRAVPGGGDALVDSLYLVLENHRGQYDPELSMPSTVNELRVRLANELMANASEYSLKLDRTVRTKIRLGKLPGQVPPTEFMQAFAKLYGLQVWVHHGASHPMIFDVMSNIPVSESSGRVHLQTVSGIHYNPLSENRLYTPNALPNQNQEESEDETEINCCIEEDSENLSSIDTAP